MTPFDLSIMEEIWNTADIAGKEAADLCFPVPMIVEEHENVLNDKSKVVNSWRVDSGVCGFAWVVVRPGNSKFARFMKKYKNCAINAYSGGMQYWIHGYGQSMEKKFAYAVGFANALKKNNIDAYPNSRMD